MSSNSTPPWDQSDLIRRVSNALDFALLKIEALRRGGADFSAAAATEQTDWHTRQKALAETAVLLWCVAPVRREDRGIDERLEAAAVALAPMARGEDVLSAVCADPGQADAYSVGHIVLQRMGYPDARFDDVLAATWHSSDGFEHEQTPFRRLERAWLARMLGRAPRSEEGVLAMSMLGRPIDILVASTFDLYAFTHALMFACDFGLARPLLPRAPRLVLDDADAALAASLESSDLDLTAELALSWPLLAEPWSDTATFAFGFLADVEDREGFLPVLGLDLSRHRALPAAERAMDIVTHSYHSVYVMGILCATALRRRHAPPATPSFSCNTAQWGAAAAVLRLLDRDAAPASWEGRFRALDPRQQDGLAAFALAALLRRSGKRGQLALLREALQVALDFGLAGNVALQAASLLRRCQRFAEASSSAADAGKGSSSDVGGLTATSAAA